MPYPRESFDHVFVCFVLEHLSQPIAALNVLKAMIVPGGTITVIEGDHGSAYFHPDSAAAQRAVQCQVELQRRAGGVFDQGIADLYRTAQTGGTFCYTFFKAFGIKK